MRSPLHNVGRWLARRAATAGDRPAVADAEHRLDYAALSQRTLRCAAVLSEAGVTRGDRVALLLDSRSAYLELVFAAARLGAIAVPVNARFTAPEIQLVLDDCTPKLLVHEARLEARAAQAVSNAAADVARLRCGGDQDAYEAALAAAAPLHHLEPVSPDDPMILMYTSGTTGTPKGALLPHRKTLFNCLNAQLFFDLTARDRVLVILPLFHSFGLLILALPTLYAGGCLVLERRFEPQRVWETVERERIDFFGGVPTQFRALLDALDRGARVDPSALRFLFTAGAAVPVELVRQFERRGLLLKQGFGQTETSILCCLDARDALRKAGSVGRPVFHAEVRVVAVDGLGGPPESWRDVRPGESGEHPERGEIVVRGPITFLGYWNRPEASAETLRGEWLRTGDLATVDSEGFVTLVGRARDMYISGGENVYPAEVEGVYSNHPEIREIAILGEPDEQWGEVGVAFVVPETPGAQLDTEALRSWASERLASFKLPNRFVTRSELPRTESGKVQKHLLHSDGAEGDPP